MEKNYDEIKSLGTGKFHKTYNKYIPLIFMEFQHKYFFFNNSFEKNRNDTIGHRYLISHREVQHQHSAVLFHPNI